MFSPNFCHLINSTSNSSITSSLSSLCSLFFNSSVSIFSIIKSISALILLLFFSINELEITLISLVVLIHCRQPSSASTSLLIHPLHLLISVDNSLSLFCISQCSTNIFFFFFLTIFPSCLLFCALYIIHSFFLLSFDICSHSTLIAWVLCSFVLKHPLISLLSGRSSTLVSIALNHSAFFPLLD